MSKTYFEVSVKYRKTTESGVTKIVTEPYLVDALTFTEAESRINEKMAELVSEDFKVTNIRVANYSEVIGEDDGDMWFKSKVSLLAYDEESGKERKTNIFLLVHACDAKNAYDNTIEAMKDTVGDYSIPAISETRIVAVFPYVSEEVL